MDVIGICCKFSLLLALAAALLMYDRPRPININLGGVHDDTFSVHRYGAV